MRKLIYLLLCTIFLCQTTSAEDVTVGGINYTIDTSTKTATIRSGNSYSGSLVIPASITYNDVAYSVTKIGYSAFENCTGLTSVEIPSSVTEIGMSAFARCI